MQCFPFYLYLSEAFWCFKTRLFKFKGSISNMLGVRKCKLDDVILYNLRSGGVVVG